MHGLSDQSRGLVSFLGVDEKFEFEVLCGGVCEGSWRAGAMSIGCNMLDFIVLRGEINDFDVFEGKSTVVRVMGVRMTVVCNSVASVVVFLSQPMGVGV